MKLFLHREGEVMEVVEEEEEDEEVVTVVW